MDQRRKVKEKKTGRNWYWTSMPRLGHCILLVCLTSVGLNVFLLFFRNNILPLPARSEDGSSNVVFDNWAAGVDRDGNVATIQEIFVTPVHLEQPSPLVPKNSETRLLHASIVTQATTQATRAKQGKRETPLTAKPGKHVEPQTGNTALCALSPPRLVGLLRALMVNGELESLGKNFKYVEKGGRIRPKGCVPRERMAVIIPFRDRKKHLYILLNNLIPILHRQLADVTIFIIEQAPHTTFNRGALLNIGFLEAQKLAKFDCFVLHDVDLIPLNDRNLYRCGSNPRHYAGFMRRMSGFRRPYPDYFGGVVGFSRDQYLKVNGNSNLYFGWGGEDDDLWLRTSNKNYAVDRYDNITSRYQMIKHERDEGNDKNIERRKLMKTAIKRQDVEGLNTTKYKVNSVTQDTLYTWINVTLDMNEILETAPDYTKYDLWKQLKAIKNKKKS